MFELSYYYNIVFFGFYANPIPCSQGMGKVSGSFYNMEIFLNSAWSLDS